MIQQGSIKASCREGDRSRLLYIKFVAQRNMILQLFNANQEIHQSYSELFFSQDTLIQVDTFAKDLHTSLKARISQISFSSAITEWQTQLVTLNGFTIWMTLTWKYTIFVAHGPFSSVVKTLHQGSALPNKNKGWHSTADDVYVIDGFYYLIMKCRTTLSRRQIEQKGFWDRYL
jgi:hypothetical protein